ncbi:MAG: radical SAM protein [Anaerolineales bacterium]|nr:radical SAM protein [Anaerolineales bacterium]
MTDCGIRDRKSAPKDKLPLQSGIVYGPVNSRRLGRSLGINLLPTGYKVCSFDCIYCQYGRTQVKTLTPEEKHFPTVDTVLAAVEERLKSCPRIEALTFSGNGEPTLHPEFAAIAEGVRLFRDQHTPQARLALLSNATTCHLERVHRSMVIFDLPILKLDTAHDLMLSRLNRPAPAVTLENILPGLKDIPHLVIQCVLIAGRVNNAQGEPLETWIAALSAIKPRRVQIYSLDRPTPNRSVKRISSQTLTRIADDASRIIGVPVIPYPT